MTTSASLPLLDPDYRHLHRAAAEAEAYRARIASTEVHPTDSYAEVLARFAGPMPDHGTPGDAVIEQLVAKATGGLRATTSPRFFGWVIGHSHPTGVAADWLTGAWGQNAANIHASPAAAAVESVASAWLLDLLGLPAQSSVGMVSGATLANFVCLAAARSELLARAGWDVEAQGLYDAPRIRVLIGADAHATVFSGLKFLGLGAQRVRTLATDDEGRILPADLAVALAESTDPAIVIAQAGQINTGAIDPFQEIAPIVRAAGGWLHVDGAFGLWAQASARLRHLSAGIELADSWATDGHKWLQTPYDCGFAIVAHAEAHRRAMAFSASYLPPAAEGERNPSAFVPELSRRARGFAAWAMLKRLGRDGVARMVEQDCAMAAHMGTTLGAAPGVRLVAPVPLNQFMLRFGEEHGAAAADDLTRAVIDQVQADGVAFIGGAEWRGQWVMRVSVSSIATDRAAADQTVAAVLKAWATVRARTAA